MEPLGGVEPPTSSFIVHLYFTCGLIKGLDCILRILLLSAPCQSFGRYKYRHGLVHPPGWILTVIQVSSIRFQNEGQFTYQ